MRQKILLILSLFFALVPSICLAEDVPIRTLADLQAFAKRVNSECDWQHTLSAHLTADIDMGNAQDSIGWRKHQYSGVFDVNGHTITYLNA